MNINTTEQALLIILSVFLAIFLILGIIALVYFLRLLGLMTKTAKKIEDTVDETTKITRAIGKSIPLISLFKYFSKQSRDKYHKKED